MVNARLGGRTELCMRGIEGFRAFAIAKLDVLRLLDVMKRSVDRAR